jgi:hypothetical protein
MEDIPKVYLLLLGRSWLKQAKAHHDCSNNILIVITDTNTMTLSMEKRIMVHPSKHLAILMILMTRRED